LWKRWLKEERFFNVSIFLLMKKKNKIWIAFSLALIILMIGGGVCTMKYGAYFILDKPDREELISDIKNSPRLPERFYEIYNTMYRNSLSPDSRMHFFNHEADADSRTYCACREATYAKHYPSHSGSIEVLILTNFLEQNMSQKECLNYYVKKKAWWFKGNILYDMENKNDSEIIELFLMLENSSLYDKDRNPERVKSKVDEILIELNK